MPGPQLPSARTFLTDLFSSLPAAADHDNKNDSKTPSLSMLNPLKDLQPGAQRNIFLTLHVLFPNELLPALDLLDRRLVTRVVITPGKSPPTSGPRQREAGPAVAARGAAETAQQDGDERAAQEKTSPAASRHGPGRRQAAHHHSRDLDGNNLLTSNNSDARNAATDKNSTATAAPGSIAVTGRSAAELQPGVDAATPPAASISRHGGLFSSTRTEDDDATAAAARSARFHAAAGQPETAAGGQSNSGAITLRPDDGDAAVGAARNLTTTRNENGEQTTEFQTPVASGGLAVAPSSPRRSTTERRRADASAYCDKDDDERKRRAGNVESQSRNHLQHQYSHDQPQEANRDLSATQDPQPCPAGSPCPSPPDVQGSNLEQGQAQDDQDSSTSLHVVFYVRSASSSTHSSYLHHHQSQHHPPLPVYEVRLSAWHCTCPAFAFAAFPASASAAGSDLVVGADASSPQSGGRDWSFGGLLREREAEAVPPVCKHLLACLLVERAPGLFGVGADAAAGGVADAGLVVQRKVGVLEAAGWAAGWGGL